ncbi:hypothetical protein C0J52_11514 [Blattella germanica]|nr:hypothetical protein C0J52_11514 [Blattella germanica]
MQVSKMGLGPWIKSSPILHLLFSIVFIISSLIINLIQAILYYGLRPISKHLYRKLYYYLCRSFCSQMVCLATWWASVDVNVYADEEEFKRYFGKEHACIIGNHHYDIDWLVTWIACDYVNILGNFKLYSKRSHKYIPTFGWNFFFGENIFVTTDKEKQKKDISYKLSNLLDYKDPIMLILMAEGTRFTTEKWLASRKFAEENSLPLMKHHLLPRTTGFTTSVPLFQGKIKAIYNTQLCFKRGIRPTLRDILFGKKIEAFVYFERIPMEQVPTEEKACAEWLYKLYQKKDFLSNSFYETGDFFGRNGVKRVNGFHIPRTYFPLINQILWSVLILGFVMYGVYLLVNTGSKIRITLLIGIISLFSRLVSKLIDVTDSNKGSTIYIISGVIINLIQGLLYFGLRPFNKHLYRKINFYLSRSLCSEIVWLAVWWASVDVIFYVNQEDLKQFIGKEHACVIGNHHYDIDWLITWIVCDYLNILGNFKAYTKSQLKYIPTFGLNLYFGESIFVTTDKRKQNNCIKKGARFTVEKWLRSRKFAEQNGLPLLKYHLLPRTTGFITSIPYFQENFKAIYNTHLCFKKYVKLKHYIYSSTQDCLSDTFYETGDFFGRNGVKRVEGIHIPKTYFPLLNVLAWSTVILAFFTHVLCQLVIKGSVLMLSVVIGVILTFTTSVKID